MLKLIPNVFNRTLVMLNGRPDIVHAEDKTEQHEAAFIDILPNVIGDRINGRYAVFVGDERNWCWVWPNEVKGSLILKEIDWSMVSDYCRGDGVVKP